MTTVLSLAPHMALCGAFGAAAGICLTHHHATASAGCTQPKENHMSDIHESGAYYWNADGPECKHGAEPDWNTDVEAHDRWADRHPASDDGHICLDAPAGEACLTCSTEDGEMVGWDNCRVREHSRPKHGVVPNPDTKHQQVTVWVGTTECLERECDDYFTDDGDTDPGVERCSHVREELACTCQRGDDGEYSSTPCPALVTA